jgi:hypothetical protein|nr:MAG TPA: hypothetical protein [Caudoviricetes sp.]
MTKEELLKEIEEIKEAVLVSHRRMDVLETEVKKLEEPKPWKPEHNKEFWFVSGAGQVRNEAWDDYICEPFYNVGNCFPTEERAEQAAEKIKMLLKLEQYHDMFCPDYVPDWNSRVEWKHYVYYDTLKKQWERGNVNHCKDAVQVYFYSKETAQKVCDLLNREENDNEQK